MEVGKLYTCEEYHLMLFPDTAHADNAERYAMSAFAAFAVCEDAAGAAAYWSKQLGKPVLFLDKNIPILVLNNKEEYILAYDNEEKYVEVLAGDKKGWIIYKDFLNIKEIDHA